MKIKAALVGLAAVAVAVAAAVSLNRLATPAEAVVRVNGVGMSPNALRAPASINLANEQAAFSYFVNKGMTQIRAAGIIGNLDQESGMDPAIRQRGGGPGRGIAQWGIGGRWDTHRQDNLTWYASMHGTSASSLSAQLDFIWYELHTFSYYGSSDLHGATTIDEAVIAFQNGYEGCGSCNTAARQSYARAAYNRYA